MHVTSHQRKSHLSLHSPQGTPDYAAVRASSSPRAGARSPQVSQ